MTTAQLAKWPKIPVKLSPAQKEAQEKWMTLWHDQLLGNYGAVEKFNHGFPAGLNRSINKIKTLEVGAGLGEHYQWENLSNQDYYMLEYREEWCKKLNLKYPDSKVIHGDIQTELHFSAGYFDRVIAIHVLEHLPDLPKALIEIDRLLKPGGHFDIVIPCEGGLAYGFARKISSERLFKKHFGMEYGPIIRAEHVNRYPEIIHELDVHPWNREKVSYFPLLLPVWTANVCVGLRYTKQIAPEKK